MRKGELLKIDYLREEDIEAKALSLHEGKSCSDFPFNVEVFLTKEYGYFIQPSSNLESGCQIDTAMIACRKLLRVDQRIYDKQYERARFSMAHELGHLVLHEKIISKIVAALKEAKKTDDYKSIVRILPDKSYRRAEWQAQFFAGCVLAPQRILKEKMTDLIETRKASVQTDSLGDFDRNIILNDLAKYFQMTITAMSTRIEVAKLEHLLYMP